MIMGLSGITQLAQDINELKSIQELENYSLPKYERLKFIMQKLNNIDLEITQSLSNNPNYDENKLNDEVDKVK